MTGRRVHPRLHILGLCLLTATLAACNTLPAAPVGPSPTPVATASEIRSSPTSPGPSNVVLFIAPPSADPMLVSRLRQSLADLAAPSQLSLQTADALTREQLSSQPRIVIAVGDNSLSAADAASHPQSQFVAVGVAGLKPGPNLSLIGPDGLIPDELGFLAGYLAALITPDYRVGVVSPDDSPSQSAASLAFLNGATYYCGLCRPSVPPFKSYPSALPPVPNAASLQADGIRTVYVVGEDTATLVLLAGLGMNLIGEVAAPESVKARWVGTVVADPDPALKEIWPGLLGGQGGRSLPLQPALVDLRPGAVSLGRMRLLQDTSAALANGQIDTAVDPATGQRR
jgi:hypothetical protein